MNWLNWKFKDLIGITWEVEGLLCNLAKLLLIILISLKPSHIFFILISSPPVQPSSASFHLLSSILHAIPQVSSKNSQVFWRPRWVSSNSLAFLLEIVVKFGLINMRNLEFHLLSMKSCSIMFIQLRLGRVLEVWVRKREGRVKQGKLSMLNTLLF